MSAAAHLIHSSSGGRFSVTYAVRGITKEEIRGIGFEAADFSSLTDRYDPSKLHDGFNTLLDGEEIFYISNPALGLWANRDRFIRNA